MNDELQEMTDLYNEACDQKLKYRNQVKALQARNNILEAAILDVDMATTNYRLTVVLEEISDMNGAAHCIIDAAQLAQEALCKHN